MRAAVETEVGAQLAALLDAAQHAHAAPRLSPPRTASLDAAAMKWTRFADTNCIPVPGRADSSVLGNATLIVDSVEQCQRLCHESEQRCSAVTVQSMLCADSDPNHCKSVWALEEPGVAQKWTARAGLPRDGWMSERIQCWLRTRIDDAFDAYNYHDFRRGAVGLGCKNWPTFKYIDTYVRAIRQPSELQASRAPVLDPSDVVIACVTSDATVLTRAAAAWDTWMRTAREFGFTVLVIAQTKRTDPFPVVGVGGGAGSTVPRSAKDMQTPTTEPERVQLVRATLGNIFNAFRAMLSTSSSTARWFLKAEDDTFVNVAHLWAMLHRLPTHRADRWFVGDCGSYCGGGSGQLMNRAALDALVWHRKTCVGQALDRAKRHLKVASDTATSLCISTSLNASLINHEGAFSSSAAPSASHSAPSQAAPLRVVQASTHGHRAR